MSEHPREHELIHDIRNRLTVARANVEAFIDGKLTPTSARLQGVLQSLNQLEELLNELLASREASDAGTRPVEIDVCDVLAREYAAVEPVAAEKGVSLLVGRRPVKSEACGRFIGDPVRIGQIVSNVLLNAVRYTPSGGTVSVDCSHLSGQLEIAVDDSGPGGFSLAIAKEFVEAHGGAIEVDKPSNAGARFVVRLPGTAVATTGKST